MKHTKILTLLAAASFLAACDPAVSNRTATNANTNANVVGNSNANTNANANANAPQNLTVVPRPKSVVDQMSARGEQDSAAPTLKIAEPRENALIASSTVPVKLDLGGDLKGYKPMKDPATGMGNHIHVILDNQPYEAYYNLDSAFELRNLTDGEHTLRVFPSRPWHESYKDANAFQTVKFTVKNGGADATKPTTVNGSTMANGNANTAANTNATAAPEGKAMAESKAGAVDFKKPLLTYSRPKGEYKGADAENIMIDFWLANAKLQGDGGEYRVRYAIDNGEAKFLEKWEPIWISGWSNGKHTVKLELVDKAGNPVDNGGYNSTTREITVAK